MDAPIGRFLERRMPVAYSASLLSGNQGRGNDALGQYRVCGFAPGPYILSILGEYSPVRVT